uniref:Fibronectin type-III domain-containing protein n=1 Tax=Phlebotomus papatasi TaxID=29031 RepID=A0A1B0DC61_PHLPP
MMLSDTSRVNSGKYTVTAVNDSGKDEADVEVTILDKPGKPEGPLEVSDVHKEGCKLKWKKPKDDGGLPLTAYVLEKQDLTTGRWVPCGTVDPSATEHDSALRLRSLNLNYNAIEIVASNALSQLRHLTELKINGNRLKTLEQETFSGLRSLRRLQITDNHIEVINGLTFRNLHHLKHLKMRNNRIHTLMDGAFHGCVSLISLDLDLNGISTISKRWLFNLTNLSQLSVSENRIGDIEMDAWEFVQHLENLDLSGNRLVSIGRMTLMGLPDLKRLNLRGNSLSSIDEAAFHTTQRLTILDLSANEISWTIEDQSAPFGALRHLKSLHLASNCIKSVNCKAFIGLNSLHVLDLRDNGITSFQEDALEPLQSLRELHLNTTSLLCDCHLQWLNIWMGKYATYSSKNQ